MAEASALVLANGQPDWPRRLVHRLIHAPTALNSRAISVNLRETSSNLA